MNIPFILFVGFRYFKEKRKSKRTASSVLSITGITVGVMTLTAVIGVMNGFQLSFIEPILNIGSYHIQISRGPEMSEEVISDIRNLPQVTALVPFTETQALIEGKTICIIRGIPAHIRELDPSIEKSFDTEYYDMPDVENLGDMDSIIIGNQLAIHLGIREGDSISVTTFGGNWSSRKKVTGIFQTWYYEIDKTWAFVSLETAAHFYSDKEELPLTYGVKLKNRFIDRGAVESIKQILGEGYTVQSWREFNRNFFGALLMEKILMMVLVGLIFIVVGFNIFHSLKRSVFERKEEIALLKALGASPGSIKNIFILEGLLIGILGCFFGILAGLLIANNINEVFRLTEKFINNFLFLNIENILRQLNLDIQFQRVSIFSPDIFYIKNVPIRILLPETCMITFFAILCSYMASFFASRKVVIIKPAEILRYE
jgi:lipoprotein-releasing system permease protein